MMQSGQGASLPRGLKEKADLPFDFSKGFVRVVIVGPPMSNVEVYADALSQESKEFKEQIKNIRVQGQQLTIRLPDVEPRVFNTFLHWIHRYPKDANKDIYLRQDESDKCLSLVKAYVFGIQYGARNFANAAAECIKLLLKKGRERHFPVITAAAVGYLWERSGSRSALSRTFVKYFHWTARLNVDFDAYPRGFINAAYKRRIDDTTKVDQSVSLRSVCTQQGELPCTGLSTCFGNSQMTVWPLESLRKGE